MIKPNEKCPEIDFDKIVRVNELSLESLSIGTLVEFDGIHPESHYLIKIVEENGKKYTDLWFKGRPGCFRLPASSWENKEFNLAIKVGMGYCIPHFYYDYNGLTKEGLNEPRAESFSMIRFQK